MYSAIQPNNPYPDRHRSREKGSVFGNVGRSMLVGENRDLDRYPMSDRNPNPPVIGDLKNASLRPSREMSRASSTLGIRENRTRKYDPIFGLNGSAMLDGYAGLNQLEDQLGHVGRAPISGYNNAVPQNDFANYSNHLNHSNHMNQYISQQPNNNPYPMHKPFMPASLLSIQKTKPFPIYENKLEDRDNKLEYQKQSVLYEEPRHIVPVYEFPRSKSNGSVTFRELEEKLKEQRKEQKLKLKLLKQNQKIDALMQNQIRSNAQVEILDHGVSMYGNRSYLFDPRYLQHQHPDLNSQKALNEDIYKLTKLVKKSLKKDCKCEHEDKKKDKDKEKEKEKEKEKDKPVSLIDLIKNKLTVKKKKNDTEPSFDAKRTDKKKTIPIESSQKRKKTNEPPPARVIINADGELELETEPNHDPVDIEAEIRAKKKARSNLRKILWGMLYPSLLENTIIKNILNRKSKQLKNLVDTQGNAMKGLRTWMYDLVEGNLNPIFEDKKLSYDFIGLDAQKKISDQTKRTRARFVQFKLITMMEDMIAKLKTQPLQAVDMEYLASICIKEIYAQGNMFSIFEIMRLNFNIYGRIMEISKEQSHMILAVHVLIKILIYKIIFGVKGWYQNTLSNQALLNFQILGSVFYRIIQNIWTKLVPVINLDPSKIPLVATRPLIVDLNIPDEGVKPDDQELIVGAYTKQQVGLILYNNDEWLNAMNNLVIQWVDEVYKKLGAYRKLNPQRR